MNRRKDSAGAGDSDMARSFGANIGVRVESDCLCLVVARERSPRGLVQGAGGKVVIELSPTTVIAALSMAAHLSFRAHPDVRFIGPVSLDSARYERFVSGLRQARPPVPAT